MTSQYSILSSRYHTLPPSTESPKLINQILNTGSFKHVTQTNVKPTNVNPTDVTPTNVKPINVYKRTRASARLVTELSPSLSPPPAAPPDAPAPPVHSPGATAPLAGPPGTPAPRVALPGAPAPRAVPPAGAGSDPAAAPAASSWSQRRDHTALPTFT